MIVVNEPVRIGIEEYQNQLARYQRTISQVDGVHALYSMGSINAPGLSDLDLIVVLSNNFKKSDHKKLFIDSKNYDPNIFLHQAVIIPECLLNSLPYLIFTDYIKFCFGTGEDKFDLMPKYGNESKILYLMYLIDISLSRLCQMELAINEGYLDKRKWMTRLWSLTHSAKLCEHIGIKLTSIAISTLDSIRELRGSWIEGYSIDNDDLIRTFFLANNVLKELLYESVKFENNILDFKLDNNAFYERGEKRISCLKDLDEIEINIKKFSILRNKNIFYDIKMPVSFRSHLELYGFKPRNQKPIHFSQNIEIIDLYRKRSRAANLLSKYLKSKKLLYAQKANLSLANHISNKSHFMSLYFWISNPINY